LPGRLGIGKPKRLNNSHISSSPGLPDDERALSFSIVRMLTTEGPTWSTKSVKSGKPRGCAKLVCTGDTATKTTKDIKVIATSLRSGLIKIRVITIDLLFKISDLHNREAQLLYSDAFFAFKALAALLWFDFSDICLGALRQPQALA
jgi:hypothetical protein